MIVVDKPKLKFLLAGRSITVTVHHDRFRRGRTYAVGTAHNKPASCSATIVGIKVTASGRELEIVQNRDSQDLYMARYSPHGYTTKLGQALGHEDAPVVDKATQEQLTQQGTMRWKQERARREAEAAQLALNERLKRLEARYRAGEKGLEADLRVIRQRIKAWKDKVE